MYLQAYMTDVSVTYIIFFVVADELFLDLVQYTSTVLFEC